MNEVASTQTRADVQLAVSAFASEYPTSRRALAKAKKARKTPKRCILVSADRQKISTKGKREVRESKTSTQSRRRTHADNHEKAMINIAEATIIPSIEPETE